MTSLSLPYVHRRMKKAARTATSGGLAFRAFRCLGFLDPGRSWLPVRPHLNSLSH
jgi:hypothetical protein